MTVTKVGGVSLREKYRVNPLLLETLPLDGPRPSVIPVAGQSDSTHFSVATSL
ncbi:MAG: hypothetical protein AB8G99_20090 [Planctomycetaceae bacterium]